MTSRISSLGQYRGYTDVRFEDGLRTSCYVPMRDGVRLAVDIFRPSLDGAAVDEPLPALWTHARYHRASLTEDGEVMSTVEKWDDWLFRVIRHGYVAVTVDVRGSGASFGVNTGQFSAEETRDAYDMTEWIAAQAWCDGNVAMFGASYLGITQLFAATQAPPHLKAIFPEMASFDHYAYAYGGGVFRERSRFDWQSMVGNLDHGVPMVWRGEYTGPVAPVDGEDGESLLGRARRDHRANLNWYRMLEDAPYRDSLDALSGERVHQSRSQSYSLDAIERTGMPIYHLAGWFDMFPRDTLLWWRNISNPQKLIVGPWFHDDRQHLDLAAEHLRWYDHWLKGVDNGVMDEAPMHYWTIDAPAGEEWRSTSCWPLENEKRVAFYFSPGPTGTVESCNDGALHVEPPNANDVDEYVTDYTTTPGTINRWASATGGPTGYPDMSRNDAKGLTYTTAPL